MNARSCLNRTGFASSDLVVLNHTTADTLWCSPHKTTRHPGTVKCKNDGHDFYPLLCTGSGFRRHGWSTSRRSTYGSFRV